MNISNKLIIILTLSSLHLLCVAKEQRSEFACYPKHCNGSYVSIEFPFRIKDEHPEWCGSPGFDVYCDGYGDPLLKLPSGTFVIDEINYEYDREIQIKDPNYCIVQKLIALDLANTPFRLGYSSSFQLYNCSGDDYRDYQIDCLSNSDYSVVSAEVGNNSFHDPNCTVWTTVSGIDFSRETIYLTWDKLYCPYCARLPDPSDGDYRGLAIGLGIVLGISFLILIWCMWCGRRKDQSADTTTTTNTHNTNTNIIVSHQATTQSTRATPITPAGLDQVMIDSYPTVVLGENGGLIKSDNDACSICLSNFAPKETLKILPGCLHRFHVDCIDRWLLTKATCPVCRISPLHHNLILSTST